MTVTLHVELFNKYLPVSITNLVSHELSNNILRLLTLSVGENQSNSPTNEHIVKITQKNLI